MAFKMRSGNGPLKFKTMGSSPMKDRMEEVRHLGDPEGGGIWHEDETPHSDRTITAEEEVAIEKRREEEKAAKIAEKQAKMDALRYPGAQPSLEQLASEKRQDTIYEVEGMQEGGEEVAAVPESAGSYEAFKNHEYNVNQLIEDGMDPEEAVAMAQKMMDEELALEAAEKKDEETWMQRGLGRNKINKIMAKKNN